MQFSFYTSIALCVLPLAALVVFLLCRGSRRAPRPGQKPSREWLLRAARLAMDEYHADIRAGGEPHYPKWAADALDQPMNRDGI